MLRGLAERLRDDEAIMIDSTAMRVHAHGANPAGGQAAQAMARSRSSLSIKIHMACDALGYPLGFIITGANVSDFDQAKPLLQKYLRAKMLAIMDKGYDSDAIRAYVNQQGGVAVIGASSFHIKPVSLEMLTRQLKILHDYWMTCETPQVDRTGRQVHTDSVGKLGERFEQPTGDSQQEEVKP